MVRRTPAAQLVCACLLISAVAQVSARSLSLDPGTDVTRKLTAGYLSNEDLFAYIRGFANRCSAITKLHTFGKSVNGLPLIAIELSEQPGADTPKPLVKYIGNLHGDEPSGRQLLLLLAETLCAEREQQGSWSQQLLSKVRLFLIPTLNPDGFQAHTRENGHHIDLNRNFPDPVRDAGRDLREPTGREQPETLAIMNFTRGLPFVASLALHEGALVANYPFDGYPDGSRDVRKTPNPTADDPTYKYLASTYATLHTTMAQSTEFPGGITNGAQWYPLYGGMQDWNYLAAGCLEVTLELNDNKWPGPDRLAAMWRENKQALLVWPRVTAYSGLHGRVVVRQADGSTTPVQAVVRVRGTGLLTTSSPVHGAYFRPLAPGHYFVEVAADGYHPRNASVQIPADGTGLIRDWTLLPSTASPQALFALAHEEEQAAGAVAPGHGDHVALPQAGEGGVHASDGTPPSGVSVTSDGQGKGVSPVQTGTGSSSSAGSGQAGSDGSGPHLPRKIGVGGSEWGEGDLPGIVSRFPELAKPGDAKTGPDVWVDVAADKAGLPIAGTLGAFPSSAGALFGALSMGGVVVMAGAYFVWRRYGGERSFMPGSPHMLPLHSSPRPIAVRQRIA